jgi:hypothetical protein
VEIQTLPQQNGYLKSFNSKLRDEKLNVTLCTTPHQARVELEARKNYYNHHSPHSGLGWLAPYEFVTTRNVCASKRHGRCVTLCLSAHCRCTTSPKGIVNGRSERKTG